MIKHCYVCHNNGLSGEKSRSLPEILINRIPIKQSRLYCIFGLLIAGSTVYSTSHRQRQNETCSNAFAAQLKRICIHHAQVMNSQALKAGFILEAKLLLTNQPTNQPVHSKRCFTIHPLYICRPIYVGMVLSVSFFSRSPVEGLLTDEYLLA